jgi:hypothetical protein
MCDIEFKSLCSKFSGNLSWSAYDDGCLARIGSQRGLCPQHYMAPAIKGLGVGSSNALGDADKCYLLVVGRPEVTFIPLLHYSS